jgi:peptidoglycan/xylan/chitin deacetylase (PgdA/CDA1 family)
MKATSKGAAHNGRQANGARVCNSVGIAAVLTLCAASVVAADAHFQWPNGAQAAVSLGYDDAMDSQLDNAVPALDRYGLKASFYLTLGRDTVRTRMGEWRAAAANGHELANHTLFHQCSKRKAQREWVALEHDLDRISVAQLVEQIRVGNTLLNALDGRIERTFTAPCGDLEAAGQSYLPAIHADFVAIRTGADGVPASMATLDPYAVSGVSPHGHSGAQLIAIARQAAARGTMVNFTFHGIGGEWLPVSSAAHDELLRHLAENRDVYWTDTFLNIMKYVRKQKERARSSSQ